MTFDEMPEPKRKKALQWAKSHDWGDSAKFVNHPETRKIVMQVSGVCCNESGEWFKETSLIRSE